MGKSQKELWTHEEAAEYLGIPPQSLYYMHYRRTGPKSFKVGKYRRYRKQDIDAWLETSCTER